MANFTINKTKDKQTKVICQECKCYTKHKVLSSINENGAEEMDFEYCMFYWVTDYEVIQCQGCDSISFRTEHSNSESENHDGSPYITEKIYPKRGKDILLIKNYFNVPHNLNRIYKETIECYNTDCLTLCGAGTRALVEGICNENGILSGMVENHKTKIPERKKDLNGKINGLFEQGKLTKQNAEILHEHRFLGNNSIHELSMPSKQELSLAIEIIENVFDTLYEIPEKALMLKHKRISKSK